MNKKQNPKRFYKAFLLSCLMMCLVVTFCATGIHVQAGEENAFFIDAEMLYMDEETYDIQVTIENPGKDWEGSVRVMVDESYRMSTAYDVKIALPEGSEKQFVVKVAKSGIEQTNGTVYVYMVDKKGKIVWEDTFYHLLTNGQMAIHLGILSDDYAALTYLDMGGGRIYFWGDEYPVKLYELNQTNLLDKLDNMQYLIIDDYNTSVLTDEELRAISMWCDAGGMLIVGTGEYGENTLGSLSERLVDIEFYEICEPGRGQYYQYNDMLEWSNMYMADLKESVSHNNFNIMYTTAVMCYGYGDGVIAVTPYSLKELGLQGDTFYKDDYLDRREFVRELLQGVGNMSVSKYNDPYSGKQYTISENINTMLRAMGMANSKLDFNLLKWIVILYTIFVGPLLYLILKGMKKREGYWGAVVVTVVVTILLVFWAGRGHEIKNTRVFSVTAENLQDMSKSKTYLYAYNAKHDEWSMRMAEGYTYAGKLGYYTYRYSAEEKDYDSRVIQEGDRFSVGIVPSQNFENAYFVLGCRKDAKGTEGSLKGEFVYEDQGNLYGTITNETDMDFAYYAVIIDNQVFLLEGWKAGQTIDLKGQEVLYHNTDGDNYFNRYQYNYLRPEYRDERNAADKISALSAIGVGIYHICLEYDGQGMVLVGVAMDKQNTVDDNVSELPYRCVYQVIQ